MKRIILLLPFLLFISCKDSEADRLRQKVREEIVIQESDKKATYNHLEINKNTELQINKKYVEDLQHLIDNGYEKQLEYFEDEELGFWATYGYMFSYIFSSREKWEENLRVKADKYFNNISIEQEINNLYADYQKDIKNLRNQIKVRNTNIGTQQQFQNLDIPQKDITLNALDNHSRNNILLEIGEGVLEWLFGLFIVWLLLTVIGIPVSDGIISGIATVLFFIASFFMSMYNDNQLLDKMRKQHQKINIDYKTIQQQLDANTIKFYNENSKNLTP